MAWKIFKPTTTQTVPEHMDQLAKEFGRPYHYKSVQLNGKSGILVLKTLQHTIYKDAVDSLQYDGCKYFGVKDPDSYDIKSDETHFIDDSFKIPVKLLCGKTLNIHPATMEPRKILFGRKPTIDNDDYSRQTVYGESAYQLYNKYKDVPLDFEDEQCALFVQNVLQKSYYTPLDVWNDLGLISQTDFPNILFAGLGVCDDKKKENS